MASGGRVLQRFPREHLPRVSHRIKNCPNELALSLDDFRATAYDHRASSRFIPPMWTDLVSRSRHTRALNTSQDRLITRYPVARRRESAWARLFFFRFRSTRARSARVPSIVTPPSSKRTIQRAPLRYGRSSNCSVSSRGRSYIQTYNAPGEGNGSQRIANGKRRSV
jgi:hypothetical protein